MAGGSTQDLQERVAKLEALLGVPAEESSCHSRDMALVVAAWVCLAPLLTTTPKHEGACLGLRGKGWACPNPAGWSAANEIGHA
jgi:hypothetical protein